MFFLYACPTVISSIFGKSFYFLFPYFVLFILRYFPFHVVNLPRNFYILHNTTMKTTVNGLEKQGQDLHAPQREIVIYVKYVVPHGWLLVC